VGGYSETVVIKVHATKEKSGLSIPVIIKIGLKDDILIEYSNYRDYVKPKTAAFRTARIEKNIALTKLLGGIEYTLIGDSAETIVTFKKYYQTHEWTSVSKSIKNVFRICEHWYKDREKREIINIVDAYQGYYKFSFDKLENEWLKKKTPDYFKHTTISFPNIKGDFINPVYWLINKGSFQIALYQCIVHGDLNSGNILVDKNSESWLIDFYSVGKSFILRDFIELETEVKFNLIEEMELDKILKFELLLLQNCSFEEKTGNLLKDIRRKELKKGFKTIQLIREHAGKAISPETNMKAYYVGLLMHTLSLLRFYQISKRRRHHMLLSASLICKKLDEWQNQKAFDSIIEINK
jgi:thiamine kinase-like enzyme